jgi:hypothetical protein
LAIATAIIAPWLELLIFFAPDIIKLFINQDKRIREQLEERVLPDIMEKLQPEIIRALEGVNEQFMGQLQQSVLSRKQEIVASLTQAKQDKIVAEEKDDQVVFTLEDGIEQIRTMLGQLKKERELVVAVE